MVTQYHPAKLMSQQINSFHGLNFLKLVHLEQHLSLINNQHSQTINIHK